MQPGEKLKNGATIVDIYRSPQRTFVLVNWSWPGRHSEFVTWELDSDGNPYLGQYHKDLDAGRADLFERIKGSA